MQMETGAISTALPASQCGLSVFVGTFNLWYSGIQTKILNFA
jgi:hypothetical protein